MKIQCHVNEQRKHFEFENEFVSMYKSFPNLYYPCGCCKDCVVIDGHRVHCEGNQ